MGNQAKWILLGVFASGLAAAGTDGVEWNREAASLYHKGRYAEAESLYRRALESFDETSLNHALTLENLAVMLRGEARYRESEQLHLEALPRIEGLTGKASAATGRAVSNLAALYWSWGKLEKAERLSLRAEEIFDGLEGADRAANRQILASVYLGEHRYDDAERVLQRATGSGEPAYAVMAYTNLSVAAIGVHDFERAEQYARRALELADRDLPAGHPIRAAALNNLAQACRFQGKYLEAERRYREAIALWEDALGPEHPDLAKGLLNLAAFYHERGREAGAEALYQRAAGIFERFYGKEDPQTLSARAELANVLRAEQRFTEADKLSRSLVAR